MGKKNVKGTFFLFFTKFQFLKIKIQSLCSFWHVCWGWGFLTKLQPTLKMISSNCDRFPLLLYLCKCMLFCPKWSLTPLPKLYIPSTLNIDLILWHTQLIVCAEIVKSWFKSWVFPFTFQGYILTHTYIE